MLFLTLVISLPGAAWSNGGYSSDPTHPDYGTHDWIAQHALDWHQAADTYTVTLAVTDTVGRTATKTIQIVASAPALAPTGFEFPSCTPYVVVVAAVVVAAGVVMWRRLGRR